PFPEEGSFAASASGSVAFGLTRRGPGDRIAAVRTAASAGTPGSQTAAMPAPIHCAAKASPARRLKQTRRRKRSATATALRRNVNAPRRLHSTATGSREYFLAVLSARSEER